MKQRPTLILAGISGAMCVVLGAVGAHLLKDKIPSENLQTLEIAVKYQFYHTLALILIVTLSEKAQLKFLLYSSTFFITGIILFSFSLYFLAFRPLIGIGNEEIKWVGAITPFGGVSFILGWIALSASGINFEKK